VDAVRHCVEQQLREFPCRLPVGLLDQLRHGERAGSVNGHDEMELALGSPQLGNADVKEPDGAAPEPLPLRLVAVHVRQARDAMPLEASMQARARKMWDRRLQGMETVVQREQRVPTKSDNEGFVLLAQDG
jgi:hypothetical protein